MKVAIDVSQVIYGSGVSGYTQEIVKNLPKENICTFATSFSQTEKIRLIFPDTNIINIPLKLAEIWGNRLHLINIESFIKKIDIIHTSDWIEYPSKLPKITTIHDLSPFLYPQETDSYVLEVHTRKMKWAVKECKKFICVSQNTANDLQRLFSVPSSKIEVIYEAMEEKYNLKPQLTKNVNYIIAIGVKQQRKNIDRLIEAFLKYGEKLDLPQRLVLVGENYRQFKHPKIIFTGYLSDQNLVNYLAGAKAFVFPSLYEGFGLPILGAFYHKIPVVVSNVSSFPEIVGDSAIFIDPYNIESIANGIKEAIDNSEKLINLGTEQLKKFSWQKAANQTLDVYKDIC